VRRGELFSFVHYFVCFGSVQSISSSAPISATNIITAQDLKLFLKQHGFTEFFPKRETLDALSLASTVKQMFGGSVKAAKAVGLKINRAPLKSSLADQTVLKPQARRFFRASLILSHQSPIPSPLTNVTNSSRSDACRSPTQSPLTTTAQSSLTVNY
jgi:hypothetical protein